MAKVSIHRRNLEWWREAGEEPDGARLTEGYNASRLKAGDDGKNVKSITKQYGRVGDGAEDFGKAGVNEKASAKGRKVQEEFDDEMDMDMDDGLEGDAEMDMGMDDMGDLPPDLDDSDDMIDDGEMGAEGAEVAEDITVSIGGQTFKLVPVEGDEGMGDEMDADMGDMGDMGDEGMDDDIDNLEGEEIEAEDDDVTKTMESKKPAKKATKEDVDYDAILDKAIAEAEIKKEKVAKYRKAMAERKMKEDEIAKGGKANSGTRTCDSSTTLGNEEANVSHLGKDDAFSVAGQARTGAQYTPSASSGKYEAVNKAKMALKKAYKEWKKAQALAEETSPDEATAPKGTADAIDDDFANLPIAIGADPKVIEKVNKVKARREARKVRESEEPVQFPSKEVKQDLEGTMNESFDFAKLIRGDYKKA